MNIEWPYGPMALWPYHRVIIQRALAMWSYIKLVLCSHWCSVLNCRPPAEMGHSMGLKNPGHLG